MGGIFDETCWGHANHIRCYRLLDYCLVQNGTNTRIPAVHAVSIKVLETKLTPNLAHYHGESDPWGPDLSTAANTPTVPVAHGTRHPLCGR